MKEVQCICISIQKSEQPAWREAIGGRNGKKRGEIKRASYYTHSLYSNPIALIDLSLSLSLSLYCMCTKTTKNELIQNRETEKVIPPLKLMNAAMHFVIS